MLRHKTNRSKNGPVNLLVFKFKVRIRLHDKDFLFPVVAENDANESSEVQSFKMKN